MSDAKQERTCLPLLQEVIHHQLALYPEIQLEKGGAGTDEETPLAHETLHNEKFVLSAAVQALAEKLGS